MEDTEALIAGEVATEERGAGLTRPRCKQLSAAAGLAAAALVLLSKGYAPQRASVDTGSVVGLQAAAGDPNWGCGLVGNLPGIEQNGATTPEMQRFIDAIKSSSTFNKANFWNWNLAPQTTEKGAEHLSSDFIFMPEQWGAGVVTEKYVRPAGQANFLDSNGQPCPAQMADIFLGMNEPDITGSCMGNMFGKCKAPCSPASVAAGQCPAAYLDTSLPPASPNADGQCNCWEHSHATGVGFWPLNGCAAPQPLPNMWQAPEDAGCINTVIENWKKTAQIAVAKGYKYLTTPLVAEDIPYAEKFIEKACQCSAPGQCACTEASCGCPAYVGFHFYAYDCRPEEAGGYRGLKQRIEAVGAIMEKYPFVKGAIVNEVGMLNCAPQSENPICVPDSGRYPASQGPSHACPANSELPEGLATFIDKLFDIVIEAKTSDGRAIVKAFAWFNENMAGGTYNLQLFNPDGTVNDAGEAYMKGCTRWGQSYK